MKKTYSPAIEAQHPDTATLIPCDTKPAFDWIPLLLISLVVAIVGSMITHTLLG